MPETVTTTRIERVYIQVLGDDDGDFSWLEQTPAQLGSLTAAVENRRRFEALQAGNWWFVGVLLAAEIVLARPGRVDETLTLTTPGVWGVESDSGEHYFREIAGDEGDMLEDDLRAMRFTEDEIREAFEQSESAIVYV